VNRFLILLTAVLLIGILSWLVYALKIQQLNTTRFYDLIKQDPLFYDQATDVLLLTQLTQELRNLDDQILKYDSEYRKKEGNEYTDIYPEGWRLWPQDFLATLSPIHEATELFINNPTKENGQKLLAWYEQASVGYKKAIQLNIEVLENVLDMNPNLRTRLILFLGSATTPEIVLNDFLLILKNAQQLENEIKERKKCLNSNLCPNLAEKISERYENAITISLEPLKKSILGINKNQQVFGPYWAQTNCFGFTSEGIYKYPFYAVEKKAKGSDEIIVDLMLANTKYYRDYRQVPNQAVAKLWLKRGVTIRPHSGLSDYLCTDLRFLPELYLQYLQEKGKLTDQSLTSKISTMPYLIQRTVTFSYFLVDELTYNKKPFDPLFLLIARSAYSLYFGTFSDSIWRLTESPTFLLDQDFTDSMIRGGYIKYQDLVSEGMSDQDIEKLNLLPNVHQMYQEEFNLLK